MVNAFVEPPDLPAESIRDCRVFPDWMSLLAALPRGGRIAEVGVDRGATSKRILSTVHPSELHLIDVAFRAPLHVELRAEIDAGCVYLHQGDSVAMLSKFPDQYFDWVFIDADHSIEGVRRDAEVAARKVTDNGLLIFDDYIFFDHQAGEPYGVIHTVNRMCRESWRLVMFAFQQQMFCKAAIQRATSPVSPSSISRA